MDAAGCNVLANVEVILARLDRGAASAYIYGNIKLNYKNNQTILFSRTSAEADEFTPVGKPIPLSTTRVFVPKHNKFSIVADLHNATWKDYEDVIYNGAAEFTAQGNNSVSCILSDGVNNQGDIKLNLSYDQTEPSEPFCVCVSRPTLIIISAAVVIVSLLLYIFSK